MERLMLALTAALGTAGVASAQYQQPYYPQSPFYQQPTVQPNIYNSQNQPLSPYLNMFPNRNPAAGYYFGTRPGTVGGTGFGTGAPGTSPGAFRQPFFPQLANAPDPLQPADVAPNGSVLPPAGHPVYYNNTMGYFPTPGGNRGGTRPGLSGLGASGPKR